MPSEQPTVDIYCVTKWSKVGTRWEGVALDTLLAPVQTRARHALVHSYGGYSTNLSGEQPTQQSLYQGLTAS